MGEAEQAALSDLDFHWGAAYDIAITRAGWVAKRLDNDRALAASGPGGLRELIRADYAAEPPARRRCPDAARQASPGIARQASADVAGQAS